VFAWISKTWVELASAILVSMELCNIGLSTVIAEVLPAVWDVLCEVLAEVLCEVLAEVLCEVRADVDVFGAEVAGRAIPCTSTSKHVVYSSPPAPGSLLKIQYQTKK
jgi:hypothetical protein